MKITAQDHFQFREIKAAIDDTELFGQESVRRYRNILSIAVLALVIATIVFPIFARGFSEEILTIRSNNTPTVSEPTPTPTTAPASAPPARSPSSSGDDSATGDEEADATSPPAVTASAVPASSSGAGSSNADAGTGSGTTANATERKFSFGDLVTIEGWGALGGLITASFSLSRIRSSRDPAGLHLAQLALKLPAGALTGLFGIVLLQSSILGSLAPAKSGQIAAYAVLFGFTQVAFTRFVDVQSNKILDNARTMTEKTV